MRLRLQVRAALGKALPLCSAAPAKSNDPEPFLAMAWDLGYIGVNMNGRATPFESQCLPL